MNVYVDISIRSLLCASWWMNHIQDNSKLFSIIWKSQFDWKFHFLFNFNPVSRVFCFSCRSLAEKEKDDPTNEVECYLIFQKISANIHLWSQVKAWSFVMRMNFISEGNKMLLFTSFHGVLSLKDNWDNRKKKNSGNLELIWTSILIFSYVIRNEHRKCLKQIALSTTRKIFPDYPIHSWWNKHVAGNIHSSQKERNTLVNTTKQSLFWNYVI